MKNIHEVLRQKELELSKVDREVEALRVVVALLSEDREVGNDNLEILLPSTMVKGTAQADHATWGDRAKSWP